MTRSTYFKMSNCVAMFALLILSGYTRKKKEREQNRDRQRPSPSRRRLLRRPAVGVAARRIADARGRGPASFLAIPPRPADACTASPWPCSVASVAKARARPPRNMGRPFRARRAPPHPRRGCRGRPAPRPLDPRVGGRPSRMPMLCTMRLEYGLSTKRPEIGIFRL